MRSRCTVVERQRANSRARRLPELTCLLRRGSIDLISAWLFLTPVLIRVFLAGRLHMAVALGSLLASGALGCVRVPAGADSTIASQRAVETTRS
jgi:hypothetical protein